ncbi:MAG: hypothetical protein KDD35_03455 [Bdellovibrionales bacterium]|nr:hypothetical protein [Bdellovibrionales bacterium]
MRPVHVKTNCSLNTYIILILILVMYTSLLPQRASAIPRKGFNCSGHLARNWWDTNARNEIKTLYLRLAQEFERHQSGAAQTKIEQFDSGQGLPTESSPSIGRSRLMAIPLAPPPQEISYGLDTSHLKPEPTRTLRLEDSRRSQVLARLKQIYEISRGSKARGDSKAQFLKIYQGTSEIKTFLEEIGISLSEQVQYPPLLRRDPDRDTSENEVDLDLGIFEFELCKRDNRHLCTISSPFFDNPLIKIPIPRLLVSPAVELFGIWGFPGEFGVEIVNGILPFQQWVNEGLSWLLQHPIDLSSQQAASLIVGGRLATSAAIELIKKLNTKQRETPAPPITNNSPAISSISLEKPFTPISDQYRLLFNLLGKISRGERTLHPSDLIYWSSQYTYRPKPSKQGLSSNDSPEDDLEYYPMTVDIMLYATSEGKPTLIVFNTEN